MAIFSVDDIRKSWGGNWADASDTELVGAYARQIGQDPTAVALKLGLDPGDGGMSAKRLSSAVDRYQAGMYGLGEAVTGALGLDRAKNWMRSGREENELLANTAAARAQEMGAIDSYKDVKGVGDALNYAAGLGIQSMPYALEALGYAGADALTGGALTPAILARYGAQLPRALGGGGLRSGADFAARRAALEEGQGLARQVMGAGVATYPSAVADVLQNQREQNGETNLGAAAALGVPYAALNTVSPVEGALARRQLYRNSIGALDDISGIKGGLARMGTTGFVTGLKEGTSELGQEGLNQLGRMAVDPNEQFLSDKARERFGESFVGGAVLGGGMGAGLGGWRRSRIDQGEPVNLLGKDSGGPPLQLGYDPSAGAYTVFPDGSVATNAEQAFNYRYAPRTSDPNAPLDFYPVPINPASPDGYTYNGALPFENVGLPSAGSVAPGATQVPLVAGQADLFDPLMEGAQQAPAVEATATAPEVDTQTGDLFESRPTSLVRTTFDLPFIRQTINAAVGGKQDQFTLGLAAALNQRLDTPQQASALLDALETRLQDSTTLSLPTIERRAAAIDAARQLVQDFQRQMVYAQAGEGIQRAQPGFQAQAPQMGDTTEMEMRDAQSAPLDTPVAAPQPELGQLIAEADTRAAAGDAQRIQQERLGILQQVLEDPTTVNPVGRFRSALRRAGFRNQDLTPAEQQAINRFSDMQEALAERDAENAAFEAQQTAPLPGAPNEMDVEGLIPERQAPAPAGGFVSRLDPNFQLSPSPGTDEDLAALERARERRERRAGESQSQPAAPQDQGPAPRQLSLLTPTTGQPSADGMRQPGQSSPPRAPRKGKLKMGDRELEVMDVDAAVDREKQRIADLEALLKCLR